MNTRLRTFNRVLSRYFSLLPDKEDEQAVVEQVSRGVVFRGTNLWILIFAIFIASLGLNVNSTAVIIGAMLISPLMGPIIGMGLGVGIADEELFRRAIKNYGVATLISVVTATLYFLVSPLSEARSELLARTSPTLYDVLIAFCGGAAGVLALTTRSKGQVIPGVAIATALMPPLCTAGYGLATAQWSYFFGAFYLFFINTVFIALSTFLGVKLLRFHKKGGAVEGSQRGRRVVMLVVVLTLLPAAWMTYSIVRQDMVERNVRDFVRAELQQGGTQIIAQEVTHDTLRVVAVGREITEQKVTMARERMPVYHLGDYGLAVIQASAADSLLSLTSDLNSAVSAAERSNARLSGELAAVQQRLQLYTGLDTLASRATLEAAPLFPAVARVRLGRMDGHTVALVSLHANRRLAPADRPRLEQWLRTRMQEPALEIVVE